MRPGQSPASALKAAREDPESGFMPNHDEMPASWRAHAARGGTIAEAVAERPHAQDGAQAPGMVDELTRRRVARFAAEEARRIATRPPPPQPPAAS
jgi:hypothetical protein